MTRHANTHPIFRDLLAEIMPPPLDFESDELVLPTVTPPFNPINQTDEE